MGPGRSRSIKIKRETASLPLREAMEGKVSYRRPEPPQEEQVKDSS